MQKMSISILNRMYDHITVITVQCKAVCYPACQIDFFILADEDHIKVLVLPPVVDCSIRSHD